MSCQPCDEGCTVIGVFKPKGGGGVSVAGGGGGSITTLTPSVTMLTGQTAEVMFTTDDGQDYTVVWGDGSTTTHASGTTASHTYTTNYTGVITITSTSTGTLGTVSAPAPSSTFTALHLTVGAGAFENVNVTTADGSAYTVDWGDGSTVDTVASGANGTHTYATAFAGDVKVNTTSNIDILYHTSAGYDYDLSALPTGMTQYATFNAPVGGSLADMPSSVVNFNLATRNVVSGDVNTIKSNVVSAIMSGSNTIDVSGTTWNGGTTLERIYLDSTDTKSVAQLDNLLVTLDNNIMSWTSSKLIDISGQSNPTPTANGAITSLEAKGVTVTRN